MFVLASTYMKQLDKNKELLDKIDDLQRKIDYLNHHINNEINASSFEPDFNAINVFSIERNINESKPCTIVGYILDNKVCEWYWYCSKEQHHKLVTQFKAFKESKVTK